ncbi:MAG: hypothetical protein AAB320_06645 [Elusimicrobiota bacterium]
MKQKLILTIALAFLGAHAGAVGPKAPAKRSKAVKKEKPPVRSPLELRAAWTLQNGKSAVLNPATAAALGLPRRPAPVKKISIEAQRSSDGAGHSFSVLFSDGKAGEVVLERERSKTTGEGLQLRVEAYRLALTGARLAAMRNEGIVGRMRLDLLSPEDPEVIRPLSEELAFWAKEPLPK